MKYDLHAPGIGSRARPGHVPAAPRLDESPPDVSQRQEVRYQAKDMVIAVSCRDNEQAAAVRQFAVAGNMPCPAPAEARPVYHCTAKTHGNGEVLWG